MIIAVGYRVNSFAATQFRKWATTILHGNNISTSDAAKFNKQHGGLTITVSKNFHDRFLIIDDKTLYLIGASLKDLGRKCFAFTKLDSAEIPRLKARV